MQRISWQRPRQCPLCGEVAFSVKHILVFRHFRKEIWTKVKALIGGKCSWDGSSVEEVLDRWLEDRTVNSDHHSLPLFVIWAVWITINEALFQDKEVILGSFFKLRGDYLSFEMSEKKDK